MTQVINHDLGHKIVHNPGYDFDLGYKNKSKFFYYPSFKSVTCVGYALVKQFLWCTTCTGNKFKTWVMKKIQIYFYNLGQNHNLGYEQFYTLGHDL